MKDIRVGLCGVSWDYKQSLIPKIIEIIAGKILWVSPERADLVIIGPFECYLTKNKRNLTPKIFRKDDQKEIYLDSIKGVKLFHTYENVRPDKVKADFSITYDNLRFSPNNFRFPYWMEFIDWSNEGITGQSNPRFGRLISKKELMSPLKDSTFHRESKVAIFSSHLKTQREELLRFVSSFLKVDGFGKIFDKTIRSHSDSDLIKDHILSNYMFNLCPENSMHPGYNTEKIPEAFASGCIPLTWTMPGKNIDFNSLAYLNLADENDIEIFLSYIDGNLKILKQRFQGQALLDKDVSIEGLIEFVKKIL